MTNDPLIEFKNVSHKYSDQSKSFSLHNLDLQIFTGEFVTVVGVTGAGKSTLLKIILGSEKPYDGSITMDGKAISSPDKNRGIVFQRYSLFENRNVRENIELGLRFGKLNLFENALSC